MFAASASGAGGARLARAHGYVDGYMRAMLDLGVATKSELLAVVAAERERFAGPGPPRARARGRSDRPGGLRATLRCSSRGQRQIAAVLDEAGERRHARGQVGAADGEQARRADALDAEAPERRRRRTSPCGSTIGRDLAARGQVAHEAARERVARARGVEHVFERVGRDEERARVVEEERAELAALDDEHLRARACGCPPRPARGCGCPRAGAPLRR